MNMVAAHVLDILGETTNHHGFELIHLSREGVTKASLNRLLQQMNISQKEMANLLHLSPRTIQRMKESDKLPAAASGQLIEIAKVFARAKEVLGDTIKAKTWLKSTITGLNEEQPINLLDTPTGIQWVLDVLGRIEYGVYS
jgi:putative toxin-antitoxin system antitoxin component (TIGR02293 family)